MVRSSVGEKWVTAPPVTLAGSDADDKLCEVVIENVDGTATEKLLLVAVRPDVVPVATRLCVPSAIFAGMLMGKPLTCPLALVVTTAGVCAHACPPPAA